MTENGLILVEATFELLDAAIEDPLRLSQLLSAAVAEGWAGFPEALPALRDSSAVNPGGSRWGPLLFLVSEPRTLVGIGGFKGKPSDEGVVEIGYAIAPIFQRRGLATEAVRQMVSRALLDSAIEAIDAHTLAQVNSSSRILEKAGFVKIGEFEDAEDGHVWHWRLRRSTWG